MINDLWYKNAVIYCLSVGTYMDSNADGIGDFKGLMRRLERLERRCGAWRRIRITGRLRRLRRGLSGRLLRRSDRGLCVFRAGSLSMCDGGIWQRRV